MHSPWQLAGRLAQFGVGTWLEQKQREEGDKAETDFYKGFLPGGESPSPSAPSAATPTAPTPTAAPGQPSRDIAAASQPGRPSAPAIPRAGAPAPASGVILDAAQRVGVDPRYLTRLAGSESGHDPGARSDQGAMGLGQFLPGTWETYIAKYGHLYGYGPETPPTDARANALMTAHYTKDSMEAFKARYGREPAPGELYAMHFLGREGGAKLIDAARAAPGTTVDQIFPELTSRTLPDGRPNPRYSPTNIAAMTSGGRFLTAPELLQRLNGKVGGTDQVAQAPAPATPGAPTTMTDVTRQPGTIPPQYVERIRRGLDSTDPRVRAAARQILMTYAAPDKATDKMREYAFAVQQGEKRTFSEWTKDQKAPLVQIDQRGDSAYAKVVGEGFGKQYLEMQAGVIPSNRKIGQLEMMKTMLATKPYTGWGAEELLTVKRFAKAIFGQDLPQNLGPAETVQALGNMMALEARNPSSGAGMPGAMSDADREFLRRITPSLLKTPEGNAILIDYMIRVEQRSQAVAALARRYVSAHKQLDAGFYDRLEEWSKANPLFPEAEKTAAPAEPDATKPPPQPGDLPPGYKRTR